VTTSSGASAAAGDSALIVVANRLPVELADGDGASYWTRSPGGLVTALEPVLASRESIWVGWSGVAAEDTQEVPPPPETNGSSRLVQIPLSRAQVRSYYEGFCNSTLWPLYHDATVTPQYHRQQFEAYRQVNERFAGTVAEVAPRGATVLVQDYQLQLVPAMLRRTRPDLTIGFFLHIPFPPIELFMQLPWRRAILEGLLGADLVGFQTDGGAHNFIELANRLFGLATDDDHRICVTDAHGRERAIDVAGVPISIDAAAMNAYALRPETIHRAQELRAELGSPRLLFLGVDRLDYTKGIDVRMKAFVELIEDGQLDSSDTRLLQVATPSRERIEEYRRMREVIEQMVGRAMGAIGGVGSSPIHYVHQHLPREELAAMYLAADVMLVTPLRDGMNLVAKEYVAARHDEGGALVLSEFAGARHELTDAYLVNPYDADGMKATIMKAVHDPPEERQRRMRAMREVVMTRDVHAWVDAFMKRLECARASSQ
jgi:trehalose 6-phosphate synthase